MNEVLKAPVEVDGITAEIARMFDYSFDGETVFVVPDTPSDIPSVFGIGLIVGPSGSGKTSMLRRFGITKDFIWQPNKAIASHFLSAADAEKKLSAVGLNSIPSWLKPYGVLSTGERFRADLAARLNSNTVVDEYTSVVDRNVAKACSVALRRYVDREGLTGVVLASCHYDIIEWLQPDWVFDTKTGVTAGRGSVHRPTIEVDILPCSRELWPIFRPHHYLSGNLNPTAKCWVAVWNNTPVGFAAALPFPNGNFKNAWREHRTVVLSDYQGLGIGVRLSNAVAALFCAKGCRYFSKTAHPRLGGYRENSPLWKPTSKNKKNRLDYDILRKTKEDGHKLSHRSRVCFSHEFVGNQ